MKRISEEPDVNIVTIEVGDVITTSQGGFDGYAPDSDDSEFGRYRTTVVCIG
ncbi:MAG: hypothetical protein IJE07_01750 [Clostridia bacterium]|nr:hypothetical protein [Clostridia bacterium]